MTVLSVTAAATICAGLAHLVAAHHHAVKRVLRSYWQARTANLAEMLSPLGDLFNPYHPERHYMRGPGPKWHAKHARVTQQIRRRH
jgi:hypothetical protein